MRVDPRSCTLLKGLVGSTAYGLAHEGSDKDYIGMFAVPSAKLFELNPPDLNKGVEFKNPDTKFYEAAHYCRLALGCNPTILELLWLEHYNLRTEYGNQLIAIRGAFPSAKLVRDAYFGYATQQFNKTIARNGEVSRPEKSARHLYRLLYQGTELYTTGRLIVKLPDPEKFIDFGKRVAAGDFDLAKQAMADAQKKFNSKSALPANPNKKLVNEWLLGVRHGLYQHPDSNPA